MSDVATRPSRFSYEELMSCARGEMFGPGNAQLPAPPMLLFDRITNIDDHGGQYGKGYIEAEFDINPKLWFFDCHFLGDPVMPGSLGLDSVDALQLVVALDKQFGLKVPDPAAAKEILQSVNTIASAVQRLP